MPIDRDATLKKADKLIRAGKLADAIEEYVRLVEDQPGDWNSVNALGDLYVRAADPVRAVAQFTAVADHLFDEGFFAKAAAVYKKGLKVKGDDAHTLLRLVGLAERQGLMGDARAYLRELSKQRKERGDEAGVVDCLVRLASLTDADPESKVAAARALQGINLRAPAALLLLAAADGFVKEHRLPEMLDALVEAADLDPGNTELRSRLIRECVATGQVDRCQAFLTAEVAGDEPDLLLILARTEFASGYDGDAQTHLAHLLKVAPEQSGMIIGLADELTAEGRLDSAYICVEVVADAALAAQDVVGAVAVLRTFAARQPHLPALTKLVEIAATAGDGEAMRDAQARLVDGHLAAGNGVEARVITEDLISQEPTSAAHAGRLRRALQLLSAGGHAVATTPAPVSPLVEPAALHEIVSGPSDIPEDDEAPLPERFVLDVSDVVLGDAAVVVEPSRIELRDEGLDPLAAIGPLDVDFNTTLATLREQELALPPMPAADSPKDIEVVFDEIRSRLARDQQLEADAQYERGVQHVSDGQIAEGIAELQAAARMPMLRFKAAASLGRVLLARGEVGDAVDWMERAAEAPPPSEDEGRALLYDLADALARLGESGRALAIFIEVKADAGTYRDVHERIASLTRTQEESGKA